MPADQSSPTRLYATLVGALLLIGGTLGFFHSSTFGTPGEIEDALGFAVNGWTSTLHIVIGILGLRIPADLDRRYGLRKTGSIPVPWPSSPIAWSCRSASGLRCAAARMSFSSAHRASYWR